MEEPQPKPTNHRKLSKGRAALILIGLLIIVVTAVGIWFLTHRDSSPIPKNVGQSVNFPLYYPSVPPSGYHLNKNSFGYSKGLVTYVFDKSDSPSITISIQATPKNFDAAKIIGGAAIPSSVIPIGNFYNISIGNHTEYMITTNGSLMFISATGKVSGPLIYSLANSLKQA